MEIKRGYIKELIDGKIKKIKATPAQLAAIAAGTLVNVVEEVLEGKANIQAELFDTRDDIIEDVKSGLDAAKSAIKI